MFEMISRTLPSGRKCTFNVPGSVYFSIGTTASCQWGFAASPVAFGSELDVVHLTVAFRPGYHTFG